LMKVKWASVKFVSLANAYFTDVLEKFSNEI
jgi:hypothetical protein